MSNRIEKNIEESVKIRSSGRIISCCLDVAEALFKEYMKECQKKSNKKNTMLEDKFKSSIENICMNKIHIERSYEREQREFLEYFNCNSKKINELFEYNRINSDKITAELKKQEKIEKIEKSKEEIRVILKFVITIISILIFLKFWIFFINYPF